MSAAKMVADSTQAEPTDAADGKKRKKKVKKTGKKVNLPEDEDSDLDLKRELQPISAFVKSRNTMVEEMFRAVRGASLQRALPDLLKSIPLDELKQLCLEQLEVMSKKRLRRILAGEESANISSSGTEDDTTDEEAETANAAESKEVAPEVEAQPADSTSVHQDSPAHEDTPPTKQEEVPLTSGGFVASFQQVEVKQEPPDSADEEMAEEEMDDREDDRERDDDALDEEGDPLEEEDDDEEEEGPENYTSGSEDGELVRREEQISSHEPVEIKQEVMSDSEEQTAGGNVTSQPENTGDETTGGDEENTGDEEDDDDDDDEEEEDEEEMDNAEGSLVAKVGEEESGGDMVLPSIMMDQMELLELEMRARAIKAMLSTQEEDNG